MVKTKILCKLSGKYKMKAVKTTEKQEYLFEYSCFFFKNSISLFEITVSFA